MKKAIGIVVAVVLVLLVAAAAWLLNAQQRAQQERVLAEMRTQTDTSRTQLDKIATQQEQIVSQQKQIASQQEKIRHTLSQTQGTLPNDEASLLMRDDLTAVAAMRVAIAEHYANWGKMPLTNAEAGLPAPDQYRGKSLQSATLRPDGRIELVFDAQSGVAGGRVLLVADISHANAMGIQWRCETPDYPLIKRALPTCDYQPAGTTAQPQKPASEAVLQIGG